MFTGAFNPLVPVPKPPQGKKSVPTTQDRTAHHIGFATSCLSICTKLGNRSAPCTVTLTHVTGKCLKMKVHTINGSSLTWFTPTVRTACRHCWSWRRPKVHTSRTSHTRAHTHTVTAAISVVIIHYVLC